MESYFSDNDERLEVDHVVDDKNNEDDNDFSTTVKDNQKLSVLLEGRPTMNNVQGSQVFFCRSTPESREIALDVKSAALATSRIHATSTTGTPWLFARRISKLEISNVVYLSWCKKWINEIWGVSSTKIIAGKSEPHIIKYDHKKKMKLAAKAAKKKEFDGIGTHQDGSFVTCICCLSEEEEYTGGGTYFPHLGVTVQLKMGEVLLFQGQEGPYSAPHRAQPIASGKRMLYIAFFKIRKRKKKKKKSQMKKKTKKKNQKKKK